MKRISTMILVLIMLSAVFPQSFIYADDYIKHIEGFSADFSDDEPQIGSIGLSGGYYETIDKEHGKTLMLTSNPGDGIVNAYAEKPIDTNAVLLSLDIYAGVNSERGVLELFEADEEGNYLTDVNHIHRALYLKHTGRIAYFTEFNQGGGGNGGEDAYHKDTWYHFDIWIDKISNTVEYYKDGAYFGSAELAENFKMLGGFRYTVQNSNGGGTHGIDNVKIAYFPSRGKKVNIEGVTVPEGFDKKVSLNYNPLKNQFGFIYRGYSAKFIATLYNGSDEDTEVTLKAYSLDDMKKKDGETEKKVTVKKGEFLDIDFSLSLKRYGYHTLYSTLYDSVGNILQENELIYSNANMIDEGVQNKKYGTNAFLYGHVYYRLPYGEADRQVEMIKNLGYSTVRTGVSIQDMGVGGENGFYFKDTENDKMKILNKHGLDNYFLLDSHSHEYESPPVTEAGFAAWKKYVESVIALYGDVIDYYQVFNEVNGDMFNITKSKPEHYVRLCKETYETVKAKDPTAKVVGFAVSPVHEPNEAQKFMRECFELGIGNYMDIVDVHTYVHDSAYPEKSLPENAETARERLLTDTHKMLEEFNCSDKPVFISELGWSSSVDVEDRMGKYMVRYAVMNYDRYDHIQWFTFQNLYINKNGEDYFGITREDSETYSKPYPANSARPAFFAIAFYNKISNNAKLIERVDCGDDTVYAYRMELEDKKQALVVWNRTAVKQTLGFSTDAEKAVIYDINGNGEEISSLDGTFTFDISDEPVYLIGDFTSAKIDEAKFDKITEEIVTCENENFEVSANNLSSKDVTMDFLLSDNIRINNVFGTRATLEALSGGREGESIRVYVKDKSTGTVYYTYQLKVKYNDIINLNFKSKYFRNGMWYVMAELKNNSAKESVSGYFTIEKPSNVPIAGRKINFDTIIPKDTSYISIILPKEFTGTKAFFSGQLVADNGKSYDFADEVYFAGFTHINNMPVIDGNLEDWSLDMPLVLDESVEYVALNKEKYTGNGDVSGKIYGSYDDKNFYLAAIVTDNIHSSSDNKGYYWAADGIQIAFADRRTSTGLRTEYSIGEIDGVAGYKRESYMVTSTGVAMEKDQGVKDEVQVAVKVNGGTTYYEVLIPWTEIYGENFNVSNMSNLVFSVLINDNDGSGRKGFLEFSGGIGTTKNAADFISMPLLK